MLRDLQQDLAHIIEVSRPGQMEEYDAWKEAIERAIAAEAEVERLKPIEEFADKNFKLWENAAYTMNAKLRAENAKLRKVVEAARELFTQVSNRTKTTGLDMSNYHAISITVKPGDAGRDYWEAVWAFEQALAELDKEGER